jgi:hypothetical protein
MKEKVPITYVRSSSYNSWDMCQHKFMLEYILGQPSVSGKKAEKGNITHKTLEIITNIAKAKQDGKSKTIDPDYGPFLVSKYDPDQITRSVYKKMSEESSHAYYASDLSDCLEWVDKALTYKDGLVNPFNLKIIEAEQYFDLEIKEEWAKYHYTLPDGELLCGYLNIKGSIDLIYESDENTIEILDYKTGRMFNWATSQEKTEADLQKDPQLLMYFYAVKKLYPQYPFSIVNIYYINAGGVFSVCYDIQDMKRLENMLQNRFETIKNTKVTSRIRSNKANLWKCDKLCSFKKFKKDGKIIDLCEETHRVLTNKGHEYLLENYNTGYHKLTTYQDGGGRKAKEE